ncbi:hypothetical protein Hanom_Chr11g00967901 [Helianthus anomalus]
MKAATKPLALTLTSVTVQTATPRRTTKILSFVYILLPKVKPCVAINALLTMMIPTEVTMLNIHAAASTAAFLSALLDGGIFSIVDPASNFLFVFV